MDNNLTKKGDKMTHPLITRQRIHFEIHPATKQTKECVHETLRRATETSKRTGQVKVTLRIIYGECSGPATFIFENGAVKKITPYKDYSRPKDIVFAVVS